MYQFDEYFAYQLQSCVIRLTFEKMPFLSLIKTQHFSPNCKQTIHCIDKCHILNDSSQTNLLVQSMSQFDEYFAYKLRSCMVRLTFGKMPFLSLIKTQHFSPNCKQTIRCIHKCHILNDSSHLDKSSGTKHVSGWWIFRLQIAIMYDKVAFSDNGLLVTDQNNNKFLQEWLFGNMMSQSCIYVKRLKYLYTSTMITLTIVGQCIYLYICLVTDQTQHFSQTCRKGFVLLSVLKKKC